MTGTRSTPVVSRSWSGRPWRVVTVGRYRSRELDDVDGTDPDPVSRNGGWWHRHLDVFAHLRPDQPDIVGSGIDSREGHEVALPVVAAPAFPIERRRTPEHKVDL